ncbi:hypothetical protein RD792_011190 [Penstemon davidsonii]|uniref:Tryptophan aminotransferase-related protein 4-like n=1 Tax=Penstemon davidsonii TaxID=160366 RepID=A0ABR0D3X6_9LAMI|nr:hypothetical protein RD792_011190 [Penstemon davidsonii]
MGRSRICFFSALASVVLNIFLLINLYNHVGGGIWEKQKLSWTQKAAEEAEAVALINCSVHGRAYLDGFVVDGKPICECNTCYQGPDCSRFIPDCAADADSGDPLFLEPFWMQHAASSAVLVPGWHRMTYRFADHTFISEQLKNQIFRLHSISRNAITKGKYIVFGGGSTQLLSAAVFALSANRSSPSRVVADPPYYPLYRMQTDYFETARFEFEGNASMLKNNSDSNDNVIEFVTSPNNPDGILKKVILKGSSVKTIHDHAYYWPHYTAIPAPSNEDVMIFTLSKLTGHAGSRFGWAIVKDKEVYENMANYILIEQMGISRDTQLRAFQLLKAVLEGNTTDIFNFAYERMRDRWEKLEQIISLSKRFSIQEIPIQFCNFFEKDRGASPAYAWLKCEREEDTDCNAVLLAANVIGREGSKFMAEDRYVRLSLLRSQDDFDLLLRRLTDLVSEENGAQIM